MEKLLTVQQLSDLIQVNPKTIYQWTHIGFVPHYKFPKGVRFRVPKIEKWLMSKRIKGKMTYRIGILR